MNETKPDLYCRCFHAHCTPHPSSSSDSTEAALQDAEAQESFFGLKLVGNELQSFSSP